MKHPSNVSTCGICKADGGEAPIPGGIIFENDLWLVRHVTPGRGVPGWMMVQTQRHVAGIGSFNDTEASNFGAALRHLHKVLQDVTGALRIYTASMNESAPHFHCHLVPRYAKMPKDASAWDVFDLFRASAEGEIAVDAPEAERLTQAYRAALKANPPPL
jgi:diadenosine tetraphosphate (Ap4A) HIT family hydrolase